MAFAVLHILLILNFYRPTWADYDRDQLNSRHEVLAYLSIITPELECNGKRCKVIHGAWVCPYTKNLIVNPLKIDIDHVVPLKNAYESGAKYWADSRWKTFANDEENLIAVDASQNRSKGHKGPDQWPEPERWEKEHYWCSTYLPKFLAIKKKWGLKLINEESKVQKRRCS